MIQSNHSTASRAVFTSAWIEFCRTGEGRYEYVRRFGDYLFQQTQSRDPQRAFLAPPPPCVAQGVAAASAHCASRMACVRRPLSAAQLSRLRPSSDFEPRKLQAMSQRGEIPGAAKIGRQWTYDLAKLRRFVEQQEKETECLGSAKHQPGVTGEGIPSGAALRSVGGSSGGRLKQMIRQSQKRASKQAKTRVVADASMVMPAARSRKCLRPGTRSSCDRSGEDRETLSRFAEAVQPVAGRPRLPEIDGRLVAEIIRERQRAGATNATIRRDLARVEITNFAAQGWGEAIRC